MSPRLPVQTSLDHRGGIVHAGAELYPPAGAFEAIGGREAIARLVDGLYDRIEADPVLRPAFSRNLAHEREMLKLFFEAWFGGPSTYFDTRSRHGLRATHGGISISLDMADHWVSHFFDSFAESIPDSTLARQIRPAITRLARGLVNRPDEPAPGERLRGSSTCADPGFLSPVQRDNAAGIAKAAAADPAAFERHGPRLLVIAAVRGKMKAVEALLQQGVAVNAVAVLSGAEASAQNLPAVPITPLCAALAKHRDAVAHLLVEHGALYDIFTAAFLGDVEAVEDLLSRASELADAHDPASDVDPETPLMHAVFMGQLAVAQLLLERGASVAANGARLVRSAADAGNAALMELLLEHGANPSTISAGDWVLQEDLADKLVARGANVNRMPGAWIGLCCTGNSGHKENVALARAMLRCGADVTATYRGRTALHCAAKAGFVQVAEALIEHGADVNALNDDGQTPLDDVEHAARTIDRAPMRQLLIAHGAVQS